MAQSLKDFSRLDRAPVASFDVNAGLDKTLVIAKNIVKHKATVNKFYGEIPEIECSPSQINQVFLNIITNAAQAIETQGEIVDHDASSARREPRRDSHLRHGLRNSRGEPEQDSRSVLHDEGSRHRHRPRPVDRRRDHPQPPRRAARRVGSRQGLGLHRRAADQARRDGRSNGRQAARRRGTRRAAQRKRSSACTAQQLQRRSAAAAPVRRRRATRAQFDADHVPPPVRLCSSRRTAPKRSTSSATRTSTSSSRITACRR